jgi:hypothetical protein
MVARSTVTHEYGKIFLQQHDQLSRFNICAEKQIWYLNLKNTILRIIAKNKKTLIDSTKMNSQNSTSSCKTHNTQNK